VSSILINPAVITPTWLAKRDTFRHRTYFPDIAIGALFGVGTDGYTYALQTAVKRLSQSN
jgi:3-dehydroquinate dehydratase